MARTSATNSCQMTGKFDFGDLSSSDKWTTAQEIYKLNALRMENVGNDESLYPFDVIEVKSKLRGSGKALVLRFESTDGKDMELLGWAVAVQSTTRE